MLLVRDPQRALAILSDAWEEFSDLEQTAAGVDLMDAMAEAHWNLNDAAGALPWFDRLLPIAERLGLLVETTSGILGRGMSLLGMGRPREGMVLLRGAHQLAVANDLRDVELEARVLLTFIEQWGEPATGLALAREGLEIGRRRGSRRYGLWMVGNGCICALRTGDWDWAEGLLDEWLALESARCRVGRVPRRPRDPALAPGRGRDRGHRGGGAAPARGQDHGPAVRVLRAVGRSVGRVRRRPITTRPAGSGRSTRSG